MKKKIFSLILTITMLCAFVPCVQATTIVDSGICGDNLTWTLDDEGTLTISGEGEMTYNDYGWKVYKENIKTVIIEDGVTSIGNSAFSDCNNLKEAKISENVTDIGKYAFYNCDSLINIEIPSGVTEISDGLFLYCSNLKSVTMGEDVIIIGDSAFTDCGNLEDLKIPESVTSIGEDAFLYCKSLKNMYISKNVTSIGYGAFGACGENINVDSDNKTFTSIDGVVFNKTGDTLITFPGLRNGKYIMPDGVKYIEHFSFYHSNIESVILSDGFIGIDGGFIDCSINTIFIPKTLEYITFNSFFNAFGDETLNVYYEGTEEEWNSLDKNGDQTYKLDNALLHTNAIGTAPPKITATSFIGATATESANIAVTLDNTEYDSTMITVFYKDDMMVDMVTTPVSAGDVDKSIPVTATDADTVKVFIWSNLNSMKPLCEAKETEL